MPFAVPAHVVYHKWIEVEKLLQGMRFGRQMACGENFAVKYLKFTVCDMRDAVEKKIGAKIGKNEDKKKDK